MSSDSKDTVIAILKSNCTVVESLGSALKPYEISLQQFNVLRILRGQKGIAANLSTVQKRMINKMSNTTRIIDKLVEKNYVNRITCEKNRRKIELFITKEGLNILKSVDRIIDKTESQITQNLSTKERRDLILLLNQINL